MIRNSYNQIPHSTSIPKGKEGHTQNLTKIHEKHVQLTEYTSLSETGGHSATLIEYDNDVYFYLFFYFFFILNYNTEQNRKHNGQLIFS